MRRLPLPLLLSLLAFAALAACAEARAQNQAANFRGDWNHAVYATDKSELPPAYQSMDTQPDDGAPRAVVDSGSQV